MTGSAGPDRGAPPRRSAFELLGVPTSADVTDEDVRAAWRRIAAATHPDRPDGGDPARFAAASAAYTTLRTRAGRGEALADLAHLAHLAHRADPGDPGDSADLGGSRGRPDAFSPPRQAPVARQAAAVPGLRTPRPARPVRPAAGLVTRAAARVRNGRPFVLAVRLVIVAAVGAGSAALAGPAPATPALITGAATWLLLTARGDLAPPG